MPSISVVSAYYKNEDMTVDFLENLKDKLPPDTEVILVNAASTPIDHEIVDRRVELERNHSFANSMNAGLRVAKGDYVCVIGNDVFPHTQDWLEKLVEVAEKSGAYITAPINDKTDMANYPHQEVGAYYTIPAPHMFPAVCWLLSRECLDKVGLFDEDYEIGTYEDNAYCREVHRAGGVIIVTPEVSVGHLGSQTMNLFDTQKVMQTNYQKYVDKYG